MDLKKLIVVTGHYGSGKTNFSVNLALRLAERGQKCTIIDLDIVNPYFRTADFESLFQKKGIALQAPVYAGSNLDIPALDFDIAGILAGDSFVIIDVGGDDEGAKALGQYAQTLSACESREMLCVVNQYRYLTKEPEEALTLMHEIEAAGKIKCTGIVNNSNLGAETTLETVRNSLSYAEKIASAAGLPIAATAAEARLLPPEAPNPFPVDIYVKTMWS